MLFKYPVMMFISNYTCCGCIRQESKTNAVSRTCEAPVNRKRKSAVCYVMFLDTLCSKKSYDMPHIGCVFPALVDRHSACSL